ncbi:SET and MYND domain-containing protein 4 [Condylostylus longicornis]|uniref:SET and MYND domain-containing protein 4 n=1 Tax=Condylostylus longicornis TaxID=2530218 RepID=UPI00244DFB7D|nr:SET and MYND domain-containing protein 4 [Condylostylus longicornis]
MSSSSDIYSQACSFRTIQSDKNGFFREFYEEVKESCGEKWLKNYFGQFKSDQARILSIFNDREISDIVMGILENVQSVYKKKDATFSAQRRIQAEKSFLLGDYSKALILINQAILRAPEKGADKEIDGGLTLALALWQRSSILIEMGEGERALADLKLTTTFGLNTKQNPEFYIKMAKAYTLMGENARAKVSLGVAESFLAGNEIKIEKARNEIEQINPTLKKVQKPKVPSLTGGENSELKGASNLLTLAESPDKGRYIIAKDNLKTGDIVLTEEPIAACLLPNYYGTHCHHCLQRLITPIGCYKCSGVAFCSYDCMTEAFKTYHKYECQYTDLMIGSGMSILCYIVLRIFTQSKTIDDGLQLSNELITKLCTHNNLRQPEDFLARGLMAAFLLRCLQKSGYFGIRITEGVNPTSKEIQVATALLGLLQVVQYNVHEIYETILTNEHRFDGSKVVYIGAGLYRVGSYFNHECWPGVARYFCGKSIILACTHPVKSGDTVYENYGPVFTKMILKERQQNLKGRYLFQCNCDACRENWPTLQKLDKMVRFRCTTANCDNIIKFPKDINKDVRCTKCRKNISLKESVLTVIKAEELYRQAAKSMKEQDTEAAIDFFKEGIDLFYQVAVLPHKDTLIAQESLRSCYGDTANVSSVIAEANI